jgi:hypothetical protein
VESYVRWPGAGEYSELLTPQSLDLAAVGVGAYEFVSTRFSRPVGVVGSSAVVYGISASSQRYALRLFTRDPGMSLERYRVLTNGARPHLVEVPSLVEDAISVGDATYPVLVGRWVEGRNLDDYLDELVANGETHAIVTLANQWADLVNGLQSGSVAHGDLQHGNVLVEPDGRLTLVDLDALWTPAVAHLVPDERGHENYQHPRFDPHKDWGRWCDTFPALVISLSMAIAAEEPGVWGAQRAQSEEQMVIGFPALADPTNELWGTLCHSSSPTVAALANLVRVIADRERPPAGLYRTLVADVPPLYAAPPDPTAAVPTYLRSTRVKLATGEMTPATLKGLPANEPDPALAGHWADHLDGASSSRSGPEPAGAPASASATNPPPDEKKKRRWRRT